MSKMIDHHEIVPKCLSEYHTFSNVEFQKHSRIDNKPMYMKILTVWALTSEKNLRIEFPGSQNLKNLQILKKSSKFKKSSN